MEQDFETLQSWVGRSETAVDRIAPGTAAMLAATLDLEVAPADGDPLPPLWHWLGFLPRTRHAELGTDGHAHRGGFLPPVPLPRRMWAGSRCNFAQPLHVGERLERVSTIRNVVHKHGRSGALVFVTVEHAIHGEQGLAVVEEHDIVYREAAQPGAPAAMPKPAPHDPAWSRAVVPDPVLLFRYSALTFNGHRIHYDRRYTTKVEGYPGLVVHGPLQATLLLDLLRREQPDATVSRFAFRALRPVFDTAPFRVCGRPQTDGNVRLWIADHDHALAMDATATLTSTI